MQNTSIFCKEAQLEHRHFIYYSTLYSSSFHIYIKRKIDMCQISFLISQKNLERAQTGVIWMLSLCLLNKFIMRSLSHYWAITCCAPAWDRSQDLPWHWPAWQSCLSPQEGLPGPPRETPHLLWGARQQRMNLLGNHSAGRETATTGEDFS